MISIFFRSEPIASFFDWVDVTSVAFYYDPFSVHDDESKTGDHVVKALELAVFSAGAQDWWIIEFPGRVAMYHHG